MKKIEIKNKRRLRRKKSIRKGIFGTIERPRLSVFRSNKYIYVQAIDDDNGKTIAFASNIKAKEKLNIQAAEKIGKEIAEKLKTLNIESVIFDRNGFIYTGKIKALADAARSAGLKF